MDGTDDLLTCPRCRSNDRRKPNLHELGSGSVLCGHPFHQQWGNKHARFAEDREAFARLDEANRMIRWLAMNSRHTPEDIPAPYIQAEIERLPWNQRALAMAGSGPIPPEPGQDHCPGCWSVDRMLRGGPSVGLACADPWHGIPGDRDSDGNLLNLAVVDSQHLINSDPVEIVRRGDRCPECGQITVDLDSLDRDKGHSSWRCRMCDTAITLGIDERFHVVRPGQPQPPRPPVSCVGTGPARWRDWGDDDLPDRSWLSTDVWFTGPTAFAVGVLVGVVCTVCVAILIAALVLP